MNFLVMGITFAFAATDLQISEVLRFVGAFGGFIIVFAVPAGIDYVKRNKEGTWTLRAKVIDGFVIGVGLLFLVLQFVPQL